MKGENMKKIALFTALVAATAFPLAAAQAFNPQPDPPGKMLVNARFVDQSIEDPDIKVSLAGELWCGETTIPSNLVIQFEDGRFKGQETANVMCTFNDPADRKAGGTWIGEVLGECNGTPATAQLRIADLGRTGDIEVDTLKSPAPECAAALSAGDIGGPGDLNARMIIVNF
jgi:hypothetical protein